MVSAGGNIKVLVGHAFLIEARVVGNSVRIVVSPAWKTYGFPVTIPTEFMALLCETAKSGVFG